jgi:hypothetical protein
MIVGWSVFSGNTAANPGLRMCIPTALDETGLGSRCGDNFVHQDTWERVILQAD